MSEDFSPAEAEYFNSEGADTMALESEVETRRSRQVTTRGVKAYEAAELLHMNAQYIANVAKCRSVDDMHDGVLTLIEERLADMQELVSALKTAALK
jgi:predicted XRE-type DNA-binding protein